MKNKATILTLLCFGVSIISLFLPFYEGPRSGTASENESFAVLEIYDALEFRTTMVVFNGFGSVFALVNLFLSGVLLLAYFYFPRSFAAAISIAVVFAGSLLLLMYATSEGRGIPFPDSMLVGFYLMLISQFILIMHAFTRAITAPPKDKRGTRTDLLDF